MSDWSDAVLAIPNLRAYFPLDEPSGTVATNLGSGPDGTYTNTPTLGVAGAIASDPTSTGITLDATADEYVTSATDTAYNFGTGDFSLGLWMMRSGTWPATSTFLIARSGGGGATEYDLYLNASSGTLSARCGTVQINAGAGVVSDGVYHFYVFTADRDGNGSLYRDGGVIGTPASLAAAAANDLTRSAALQIGRRSAGSQFTGSIDEVFTCASVLSAADVLALYETAGEAPPPSGGGGAPPFRGGGYWPER